MQIIDGIDAHTYSKGISCLSYPTKVHRDTTTYFDATMKGTRSYSIYLTRVGKQIVGSCTCPAYSDSLC